MRLALDMDGVLADVIESWLLYSNKIRRPLCKQDITEWDFWKRYGIDRFDFYGELSLCWNDWKSIPPTEQGLSRHTKELSRVASVDIVTAREKATDPFVKEWLEFHRISYENYVSVLDGPMKADLDYDVFIDDSPENVSKFVQNGKRVFLYTQPWNTHLADSRLCRISSLAAAAKSLA